MASGGVRRKTQSWQMPDDAPKYLKDAYADIGLQEWVMQGSRKVSNPAVERYIEKVCGQRLNAMTTAWCAFFVGAKLEFNGIKSTKSGMARSYLRWGVEVAEDDWKVGDLVIMWRGKDNDGVTGHIGFLLEWDASSITILGGNQGDSVSIERFSRKRTEKSTGRRVDSILGVRRVKSSKRTSESDAASALIANEGLIRPSVDSIVPNSDKIATKSDALATHAEQTVSALQPLASYKPWIMGLITALTLGLAAYTVWKIWTKD